MKNSCVIFVFAFIVRLFYCYQISSCFFFNHPLVDSLHYHNVAVLLMGESTPIPLLSWQPVWISYVLSVLYSIGSPSAGIGYCCGAFIGAINCLLTYQIARRYFGEKTGLFAGMISALYAPLIFFECALLNESWAIFWVLLGMKLLVSDASGGHKPCVEGRRCVLWGLLGALILVTRPLAILIWGIQNVYYSLINPESKILRRIRVVTSVIAFCLFASIFALIISLRAGGFVLMAQSGGVNAYIGTHTNYLASAGVRPGHEWDRMMQGKPMNTVGDFNENNRYFYREALNNVLSDLPAYSVNLLKKAALFFVPYEIPRNESIYVYRSYSSLLSGLLFVIHGIGFPFALLAPFVIWGTLCNWRRVKRLWVIILPYMICIVAVFHVNARYRIQIVPFLIIMASVGLVGFMGALKRKSWIRRCFYLFTLFVAYLLFSFWAQQFWPIVDHSFYQGEHARFVAHGYLQENNLLQAEHYALVALEKDPDDYQAMNLLGYISYLNGDVKSATSYFQQAIALRDDYFPGYFNMGKMYKQQNNYGQAIRMYEKGLSFAPDDPLANEQLQSLLQVIQDDIWLGNLYMQLQQYAKAKMYYTRMVNSQTQDAEALNNLAWLLMQETDEGESIQLALNYAKKAVELTGERNYFILETYAAALAINAQFEEAYLQAQNAYRLAVEADDDDAIRVIEKGMAEYELKAVSSLQSP